MITKGIMKKVIDNPTIVSDVENALESVFNIGRTKPLPKGPKNAPKYNKNNFLFIEPQT